MILPPFVGRDRDQTNLRPIRRAQRPAPAARPARPGRATIDWFAAHQFWGVAVVEALSLYPIIYLNAVAALANIDPAMEEAAENLGCTGLRRFRRSRSR
jgi:iron(III) transport system permease protein